MPAATKKPLFRGMIRVANNGNLYHAPVPGGVSGGYEHPDVDAVQKGIEQYVLAYPQNFNGGYFAAILDDEFNVVRTATKPNVPVLNWIDANEGE